jgi:hypothetical protein
MNRVGVTGALLAAVACAAPAQSIPKSQLGSVTQTVAGTRVEITYRRPVARGRTLFGDLVPWGKIWTPSADSAVVFSTSAPIEINGAQLAAGTYSLWAIPEQESWTVAFNAVPHTFHLAYPDGRDVLRVRATPKQGAQMETLAFYFPLVDADSAALYLHWGTTIIPLSIRARPH